MSHEFDPGRVVEQTLGCDRGPDRPDLSTVVPEEQAPCLLNLEDDLDPIMPAVSPLSRAARRRAFAIRALALLCACSLSIGSHYASYILSPLKSRLSRELGTSNTEFSLLISAFSLNSTWTPLLGGVLASRLGTTMTSILATGVILLGQIVLLIGDLSGDVRLMALGMFIFGLGISPLAVVQETIIVRFFKSHGLGVSMALGLVAGKSASFIAARTSYPLTERFGPHAPFYVATSLAAFSVLINLIYITASKWFIHGAGAELEATDISEAARDRASRNLSEAQALEKVAEKRRVKLREITKLGDVFWAYIGLNIFCGMMWAPFTHLAANILEQRYALTEKGAADQASYLLAGSMILYPICGRLVDRFKHRPIVIQLFVLSSVCTMLCYTWLALPPQWTQTPAPGAIAFGFGHGFAPLLLVVIVPQIVPLKYVSTALGAHKSLEQTGSTIFQTLAGLSLDVKNKGNSKNSASIQRLLNTFVVINVLQFLGILGMFHLDRRQKKAIAAVRADCCRQPASVQSSPSIREGTKLTRSVWASTQSSRRLSISSVSSSEDEQLLGPDDVDQTYRTDTNPRGCCSRPARKTMKEIIWRGELFVRLSGGLIIFAWVLFMAVAWTKLRSKTERGH